MRLRRVLIAVACAAVVLAPATSAPTAAAAEGSIVVPSAARITAPGEYFQAMWQDRMDFSNWSDFDTTPRHMIQQGSATLADGRLSLSRVQQVYMLRSDPGSYPTTAIRDPRSRPLDANRYRRITIRMYSDRDSNAAMFFRRCNSCENGLKYFHIKAGWHSYDLDMTGSADLDGLPNSSLPPVRGASWGGRVEMLWMITSFDAANLPELSMDEFGIVESTPGITASIGATGGAADLWMDTDGNTSNDGSGRVAGTSASYLTTVTGPTVVRLPTGLLRPGQTARFYTRRGGVSTPVSDPVQMPSTSRPMPRVLSPTETTGQDWAAVRRGDPWDMSQPSDARVVNAASSFSGGFLHGWTGPGRHNDPVVSLPVNTPIDGRLFHKVALTITYDGPWGLEDAPGGGLVGRVVWHPYGGAPYQVSDDLVLRTGRATYVVEMRTWPPTQILDPAGNTDPIGWGTGRSTWISALDFHPHEDPGARSWHIDDIKLLRNEFVVPGGKAIDISFIDDAWAPGTTADIVADPNLNPDDPAQVVLARGLPVTAGQNRFRWSGATTQPGTYYVRVILRRNGWASASYSFGAVDVSPAASAWPPVVK
ncbi:MAG: hypothetical protein ACK4V6_11210 [Microthrixaceae bacterium]